MPPADDPRSLLEAELDRYSSADPFGVLRLPSDAGRHEVRRAFLLATKRLHPHRFARLSKDVRRMATDVFIQVIKAYQELATRPDAPATVEPAQSSRPAQPTKPAHASVARGTPYEGMPIAADAAVKPTPPTAESVSSTAAEEPDEAELLDQAKTLCRRGQWPEARGIFRRLAVARPQEKTFRVYMHYCWGREHQSGGRLDDARAEYERALHLDAEFGAAAEARATLPADAKKKRGLVSKLWRK